MSFLDRLFGTQRPAKPAENTVLLTSANTPEESLAIEALLRSAQIPYQKRERGAGSSLKIVTGYNMICGTDFYVPAELLEDAQALLETEVEPEEDAGSEDEANE